jgi:magnesium transporter
MPSKFITSSVAPYMNDVYDHIKEAIGLSETCRVMINDLMQLFYASTSYKLNEIIKVLTVISTIFIPLTFIVGLYGMNFKHIPEFNIPWAYPVLLGVMLVITLFMIYYFKKKKWF